MNKEKVALGFISALVVGGGQILKGDTNKGLKLMLTFYFGLPLLLYMTLGFSGALFLMVLGIAMIFSFLFWAFNIWDATR